MIILFKNSTKIDSDLSGLTSWITLVNKIIPDTQMLFVTPQKFLFEMYGNSKALIQKPQFSLFYNRGLQNISVQR